MSSGGPGDATEAADGVPTRLVLLPSGGRLQRWSTVVAGLIVLAILKPWAWGQSAPSPAPGIPQRVIEARPTATTTAVPVDPAAAVCHESPSWRIASVGDFVGSTMREWAFITPVAASGPQDPEIPFAFFAFDRVEALGYCAPTEEPPGSGVIIGVFQIAPNGDRIRISVSRLDHTPASSVAGLFRPGTTLSGGSPRTASPNAGWLPGRYVFSLRTPPGLATWFGVELVGSLALDASRVFDRPTGFAGPYRASSDERLSTETAITEAVRRLKALRLRSPSVA